MYGNFEKSVRIAPVGDEFDSVRAEYSQMLKGQLSRGNNGLTKAKYLTFGIEAASMRQAKPRLDHVETDLLNNFRRIGVTATVLNGKERLRLMHSMFHMGEREPFTFEWKWLMESGLSVKDFIAPAAYVKDLLSSREVENIFENGEDHIVTTVEKRYKGHYQRKERKPYRTRKGFISG